MTDSTEPASSDTRDDSERVGYAEAIAELDEILGDLERSDVDVDVLAERVARAAQLIDLCRTRIGRARLQVEQVVADLQAPPDR